jgi:ribosome-binding factor A
MESTRQKKVGRLIQKELAEIFRIETRNMFKGNMITPTRSSGSKPGICSKGT